MNTDPPQKKPANLVHFKANTWLINVYVRWIWSEPSLRILFWGGSVFSLPICYSSIERAKILKQKLLENEFWPLSYLMGSPCVSIYTASSAAGNSPLLNLVYYLNFKYFLKETEHQLIMLSHLEHNTIKNSWNICLAEIFNIGSLLWIHKKWPNDDHFRFTWAYTIFQMFNFLLDIRSTKIWQATMISSSHWPLPDSNFVNYLYVISI